MIPKVISVWMLALVLLFVMERPLSGEVTSGADFLKNPRSARAIALGESYTAVIDDPTAIDYNPAALNTIRNVAVSMMYQTWIDNSYGLYMAGAYRLSDFVLGGSIYWFNYGGLNEYDYYGNQVGQYNPNDLNLKAAASVDAGIFLDALKGMSLGAALSVVDRNLINQTLIGFTLDAGVNYKTTLGRLVNSQDEVFNIRFGRIPLYAGFAVQNLGFAAETATPVKFSIGLAAGIIPDLIVSMDLSKDIYNTPWEFRIGAEYTLFEILSLRTGVNFGGNETTSVALGIGLRYPMLFNNLRFDYAFTPIGENAILGNNHNFSLYAEFQFDVKAEDYYVKGIYYYSKREYVNTRDMWKKALEMEPKNSLYRERLAMIEEIVRTHELETNVQSKSNRVDMLEGQVVRDLYGDKPGVVVNGDQVTFHYRSINRLIREVSLTGDMNSWDTNGIAMVRGNDGWTLTIGLKPGRHRYQYIIDGVNFVRDPNNPEMETNGKVGFYSLVDVPDRKNQPEKSLLTNQGPRANGIVPDGSSTNRPAGVTNSQTTNRNLEQKVIYTNLNIQYTNVNGNQGANQQIQTRKTNTVTYVTNKISVQLKKKPKIPSNTVNTNVKQ